ADARREKGPYRRVRLNAWLGGCCQNDLKTKPRRNVVILIAFLDKFLDPPSIWSANQTVSIPQALEEDVSLSPAKINNHRTGAMHARLRFSPIDLEQYR